MKKNHSFAIWLSALTLTALAIRLAVSASLLANDPHAANPPAFTDMGGYQALAAQFVNGDFSGPFYFQPFYYTVFLPLCGVIPRLGNWAVPLIQSLLGAATVYLAGIAAARMFGRRVGLLCAGMLVFSQILIFYTPYLLIATLQAFLVVVILSISLSTARKPRNKWRWLVLGLALGVGIVTRGNLWFFLPGLISAALWLNRGHRGTAALTTMMLILGTILPQLPFAWHNTTVTGGLSGPSTAGGAVLAMGNGPESSPGGSDPDMKFSGLMKYPPSYKAWMAFEGEISIPIRIWRWFKSEPLALIELNFRKLILFWDHREIPNNISLTGNGSKSTLLKIFGVVPTSAIMTLALAAIISLPWRFLRKRRVIIPLYLIISYWLATSAFYILARFRLPIVPVSAIFAAFFIIDILRNGMKINPVFLKRQLPALAASALFCHFSFDAYRLMEPGIMRLVRPGGVITAVSATETHALDNGPVCCGGWRAIQIKPGDDICKKFAVATTDGGHKLMLPVLCPEPGKVVIRVNGHENRFQINGAGPADLELKAGAPDRPGIYRATVLEAPPRFLMFKDQQRDYERSELNRQPIDGEFVVRLVMPNE